MTAAGPGPGPEGSSTPSDVPGVAPVADPDAVADPEPVRVDLFQVALVGTGVWLVALVVAVVVGLVTGTWTPTAVCATGAALGLVMARWSRSHDDRGRRRRA